MQEEQELRSLWDTIRREQAMLLNSAFWPLDAEQEVKFLSSCRKIIELASRRIMEIHMVG